MAEAAVGMPLKLTLVSPADAGPLSAFSARLGVLGSALAGTVVKLDIVLLGSE